MGATTRAIKTETTNVQDLTPIVFIWMNVEICMETVLVEKRIV